MIDVRIVRGSHLVTAMKLQYSMRNRLNSFYMVVLWCDFILACSRMRTNAVAYSGKQTEIDIEA